MLDNNFLVGVCIAGIAMTWLVVFIGMAIHGEVYVSEPNWLIWSVEVLILLLVIRFGWNLALNTPGEVESR